MTISERAQERRAHGEAVAAELRTRRPADDIRAVDELLAALDP